MANRVDTILAQSPTTLVHAHDYTPSAAWSRRAECGNPQCSRSWLALLKDRRRPVFEGRWGCSTRCVGAIVDAAIRHESREAGSLEGNGQQHHRVPLGLILLTRGWITHSQLQHALDVQRRAGTGRIGHWLIEECGLEPERVTRALSIQWGCPALQMDGFDPEAMALGLPKLLVEALGIVPLRIAGGRILYLAFTDRLDASAAFAMERMSGLKVQSGVVDSAHWTNARQRLCACDFVDATFEQVVDFEGLSKRITSVIAGLEPRASRLVRVHQFYWLRAWLETGAMSVGHGGIPATREDVVDRIYTVGAEQ